MDSIIEALHGFGAGLFFDSIALIFIITAIIMNREAGKALIPLGISGIFLILAIMNYFF